MFQSPPTSHQLFPFPQDPTDPWLWLVQIVPLPNSIARTKLYFSCEQKSPRKFRFLLWDFQGPPKVRHWAQGPWSFGPLVASDRKLFALLVHPSFPKIHHLDAWIASKQPGTSRLYMNFHHVLGQKRMLFPWFFCFFCRFSFRRTPGRTRLRSPPSFRGFQQHQLPAHELRLDLGSR